MANQQPGLLGQKLGMTQLFESDGAVVPVTVVQVGPCRVLQVKTADSRDGYNALQLGWGTQKPERLRKPLLGHYAKSGEGAPRWAAEIRVTADEAARYTAGQTVSAADLFESGGHVDVTGTSKGRGFAGVMKRHNFRGFIRTHGSHEYFRHGGSIGTRLTPGMTLKGKRMPGHMGAEQVTVQNLRVVRVDAERGLLFLNGSVPGPKGGLIKVRKAVKGGR
ncbi:MAG TPA: 50S ribosomal protein L3 [Myxococcota bacterium]|nr:50S ribosomal protein L3 [Myxococcota bacterium]